jgi:hypothetical protein
MKTLVILAACITGLFEIFEIAYLFVLAGKYWRISFSVLAATLAMVILCALTDSPAVRWLVGFHLFVLIVLVGIEWEEKRGRLKNSDRVPSWRRRVG